MSISITKKPSVSINGILCKWFPVHQPITFEITRMDAVVNAKYNISFIEVHFAMSYIPPSLKVGDTIQYVRGTVSTNIVVVGFSTTHVKVAYNVNLLTGVKGFFNYIDTYKGYYIETEVYKVNTSNQYQLIGSANNKTDVFGIAKVSVQKWVQNAATYPNSFLYNVLNKKIIGEGGKFNIRYREIYNGVAKPFSILNENDCLYWSNSAKQIQEKYGYNMAQYTPTIDAVREKALFQSVFVKPTFFPGYPFSLNFIYADTLANIQITKEEELFDINGNSLGTQTYDLNVAQRFSANRLMLLGTYANNVKQLDVWLLSGGTYPKGKPDHGSYGVSGLFSPYVEKDTPRPPKVPYEGIVNEQTQ